MVKSTVWVHTLSSLWLLSACNLMLGIEKAEVDSRLTTGGQDAAGGGGDEASDAATSASPGDDHGGAYDAAAPDGAVSAQEADAEAAFSTDTEASGDDTETPGATGVDETDDSDTTAQDNTADTAESTEPSEPELCDKYCSEIMELCTGDLEQYRDMRQCLTVCEMFPRGELTAETNDNTVACRLRYASKSRYASGTEHAAYCRQAGPGGDGRCGSNCEGYCTLMEGVCTPEEAGIYRFEDNASCMAACAALPVSSVPYSTANVELSDGDHVQCRIFHVTSAAMLDAEEHCEHAVGLTLCEGS